ncbi:MAG: DUF4177 domain-containing protein [Pseudomonadota bacterium]
MPRYEYKVIPAPKKPGKIKGVRGTDNKFAAELSNIMNEYGASGWEYQRTDTLPCEERQGLTGRVTTFQNMLVFRREINVVAEEPAPLAIAVQPDVTPEPESDPIPEPTLAFRRDAAPEPVSEPAAEASEPVDQPALAALKITEGEGTPLSASSEAPEGKAPTISFRPNDRIAAQ